MESATAKKNKSGTTTPGSKNAPTLSTEWFARIREDDEETMVTTVTDESTSTLPVAAMPNVPLNSPEASYAPSLNSEFDSKVQALADKFKDMSDHVTSPPTSVSGGEKGTARSASPLTGLRNDLPASQQSLPRKFLRSSSLGDVLIRRRAGDAVERHNKAEAINTKLLKLASSIESFREDTVRDPEHGVMEYSQWASYAEEDVAHALLRLGRLARDLNQKDGSKTAEQYYSEYLTKLIKATELKFDPSGLL